MITITTIYGQTISGTLLKVWKGIVVDAYVIRTEDGKVGSYPVMRPE